MIFLTKYSEINALFGELGWGIGSLADSSKYDERFVAIADEVIRANNGSIRCSDNLVCGKNIKGHVKVQPTLKGRIISLLNELKEQEGFQWSVVVGHCVDDKIKKRRRLSSLWASFDQDTQEVIVGLVLLLLFGLPSLIAIILRY